MLALLLTAALAEDLEEGDDLDVPTTKQAPAGEDWGFETSTQDVGLEEDDAGMKDFAAELRKRPPPPDHWHVDPTGKTPLTDLFEVQIAALDAAYVVAELPVLVAQGRAAFAAAHPQGLVVVGELTSGAARQVVTQHVTADAVLETGPTLVFLKAALPNASATGEVRVVVRAAPLPSGDPKPLFTRSAAYARR